MNNQILALETVIFGIKDSNGRGIGSEITVWKNEDGQIWYQVQSTRKGKRFGVKQRGKMASNKEQAVDLAYRKADESRERALKNPAFTVCE